MTIAELLVKKIAECGTEDAFGIPGGVVLKYLYAMKDRNTITPDFSINDSFHQRIKMLEEELSKEIEKNKI